MTNPVPEPEFPAEPTVDLNSLSAEDVTVPQPEFTEPPPPNTSMRTPPRRSWRKPVAPGKRAPTKRPSKTPPNNVADAVQEIPKPRRGQFVKPITQTYTSMGIMLMPLDPICANLFIQNAKGVAEAWDAAAYESDAVRIMLTKFLQASVATRITMAHIPILMGMALHHSKHAQNILRQMGEGFANTVEENMRADNMGNGVEE